MGPAEAIYACENAMRNIIRRLMGDSWDATLNSRQRRAIRDAMTNEIGGRDGVRILDDLLSFADTRHLTSIIEQNWDVFAPVFKNETRTRVSFEALNSYRRTVAHNRDLRPFERDLLFGISGQIRNMVALYINSQHSTSRHYSVIESLADHLGNRPLDAGQRDGWVVQSELEVGDTVTFDGEAWDPRDRPIKWFATVTKFNGLEYVNALVPETLGNRVTFDVPVTKEMVSILTTFKIAIRNESPYQLEEGVPWAGLPPHDDSREFYYQVNPPR